MFIGPAEHSENAHEADGIPLLLDEFPDLVLDETRGDGFLHHIGIGVVNEELSEQVQNQFLLGVPQDLLNVFQALLFVLLIVFADIEQ